MMMDWVNDFGPFQWIWLVIMVGYAFLWFTGNTKFIDVDERFLRVERFDILYANSFANWVLAIRNGSILFLLLIVFFIIT